MTGSNEMWGGRFAGGPSAIMREINASIPFDQRLWRQDIAGSRAHVAMLGAAGIVSAEDMAAIDSGLAQIAEDYAANGVPIELDREDIHMTVESRLAELIGPAAGRLHTARSRNDQVATDFKLWVRDAIDAVEAGLKALQTALVTRAGQQAGSVMPGFTHLQVAQPVTLGHHLMAFYEMIGRDRSRFADARARAGLCPLGSAAREGSLRETFDFFRKIGRYVAPYKAILIAGELAGIAFAYGIGPALLKCVAAFIVWRYVPDRRAERVAHAG